MRQAKRHDLAGTSNFQTKDSAILFAWNGVWGIAGEKQGVFRRFRPEAVSSSASETQYPQYQLWSGGGSETGAAGTPFAWLVGHASAHCPGLVRNGQSGRLANKPPPPSPRPALALPQPEAAVVVPLIAAVALHHLAGLPLPADAEPVLRGAPGRHPWLGPVGGQRAGTGRGRGVIPQIMPQQKKNTQCKKETKKDAKCEINSLRGGCLGEHGWAETARLLQSRSGRVEDQAREKKIKKYFRLAVLTPE